MLTKSFEKLGESRFSRAKFMAAMGGGLVTTATAVLTKAQPAYAQHLATPWPCFGYPECHYCECITCGSYCTAYCWWPHSDYQGHCWPNQYLQYWDTCASNGYRYRCRDWHEQFPGHSEHHCICRARLGGVLKPPDEPVAATAGGGLCGTADSAGPADDTVRNQRRCRAA